MTGFLNIIAVLALVGGAAYLARRAWRSFKTPQDPGPRAACRQSGLETSGPHYTGKIEVYEAEGIRTPVYEVRDPSGDLYQTSARPRDHPISVYFDSFDEIEAARKAGDYRGAAELARAVVEVLPAFADAWVDEMGDFEINPGPPLNVLARHLALTGDEAGLEWFESVLGSHPHLQAWAYVTKDARAEYELFNRIRQAIAAEPGVKQASLGKALGVDGRRVSGLLYEADQRGLVHREKHGRSYLLTLP